MSRPRYEADRFRIVLKPWPDGQARVLTEAWDRSVVVARLVAGRDRRSWPRRPTTARPRSSPSTPRPAGPRRSSVRARWPASRPRETGVVFERNDLKSPAEIYYIAPGDGREGGHVAINAAKVAAARVGDSEQFSFKGWNNETVYGYVVKPVDFDPAKKYPVAFLIHGGPQGSFGNNFHYRWNPQAYAGAGYAVVMVDFHGSTGYGQAFCDSIRGDWGGKPLEDLQEGPGRRAGQVSLDGRDGSAPWAPRTAAT